MTETNSVFVNTSLVYQLGDQGKQFSITTSFQRDDTLEVILSGMNKVRTIANVQRAYAEVDKYNSLIDNIGRDSIALAKEIEDTIKKDANDLEKLIIEAAEDWKRNNPNTEIQIATPYQRQIDNNKAQATMHLDKKKKQLKEFEDALPAFKEHLTKQLAIIAEAGKSNVADLRTDN